MQPVGACEGHGIDKALVADNLAVGECRNIPVRTWTPSSPRIGPNRLSSEIPQTVGNCADHNGND